MNLFASTVIMRKTSKTAGNIILARMQSVLSVIILTDLIILHFFKPRCPNYVWAVTAAKLKIAGVITYRQQIKSLMTKRIINHLLKADVQLVICLIRLIATDVLTKIILLNYMLPIMMRRMDFVLAAMRI